MKRRFTAEDVRKAVLTSNDESFSDVDTDREDCNLSDHEGTTEVTVTAACVPCTSTCVVGETMDSSDTEIYDMDGASSDDDDDQQQP